MILNEIVKAALGGLLVASLLTGITYAQEANAEVITADSTDTTFEKYAACGSIDDTCYNAWYDRSCGDKEPHKILNFYEVAYGVGLHDSREAGVPALKSMFKSVSCEVETTENSEFLESGFRLWNVDAIVFFNTGCAIV